MIKNVRKSTDGLNRSIKRVVRKLVAAVGAKHAAHELGYSENHAYRFGNPNFPDQISVRDALVLEGLCGELIVTAFMAHCHGAALLHLPPHKTHQHLNVGFSGIAKECSALFIAYLEARSGEGLDPKAARDLIVLCDELMSAASSVRAGLSRLA